MIKTLLTKILSKNKKIVKLTFNSCRTKETDKIQKETVGNYALKENDY